MAVATAGCLSFGTGTASALPDVVGGLYKDVRATLANAGYSVRIAGRVGNKATDDDCVVDRAQQFMDIDGYGNARGNIAWVYLNCYANVASKWAPGYSAGSPQGRVALDMQEQAQEQAAAENQAEQAAAEGQVPDQ